MKKIFKQSKGLFDKDIICRGVKEDRVNSTVQGKNITLPTDRKLTERVIEHCKRIARKENIMPKQTFGLEIKRLKYKLPFARNPKNLKSHKMAQVRLHRIAFKIYQDLIKSLIRYQNHTSRNLMYYTWYLLRKETTHIKFTVFMNQKYSASLKGRNISIMSLETRGPSHTQDNQG